MAATESPTYVLKYTSKTRTAIARAEKAGLAGQNIQYNVDVTSVEDPSILTTAKGWRIKSEDGADMFIVEIKNDVPIIQFELPFSHAVIFADREQESLSNSLRR